MVKPVIESAECRVDSGLLELLVCPVSGGELKYDADAQELICEKSGLAYPIRDGIPVMLPEEARQLHDDVATEPNSS